MRTTAAAAFYPPTPVPTAAVFARVAAAPGTVTGAAVPLPPSPAGIVAGVLLVGLEAPPPAALAAGLAAEASTEERTTKKRRGDYDAVE